MTVYGDLQASFDAMANVTTNNYGGSTIAACSEVTGLTTDVNGAIIALARGLTRNMQIADAGGAYAAIIAMMPLPVLAYDFTQRTDLPSRVTFTRASSATRTNASGLIETVSSNVARFDHDPVTLAARGLLIEEARTNLLLNSATLSTQNVTVTAVAHTLSFYGTGTVTLSGASTAGPLVGGGAYPTRSTLTFTPSAGTLTLTVTGTVQNAQLEVGGFATSWVPTTGASATRAADVATIATSAFPFNASAGSIYAEYSRITAAKTGFVYSLDNGTAAERIAVRIDGVTAVPTFSLRTGSVEQSSIASSAQVADTVYKTAFGWAANDLAAAVDGSLAGTDVSAAIPTGLSGLGVGWHAASAETLNGHIRSLSYYPRRITNAELQARTA